MTFSLRRKRRTIPHAAPARLARKIISAIFLGLVFLSSAQAQYSNTPYITPRFVPAPQRTQSGVVPAAYSEPQPGKVVQAAAQISRGAEAPEEQPYQTLRTEL